MWPCGIMTMNRKATLNLSVKVRYEFCDLTCAEFRESCPAARTYDARPQLRIVIFFGGGSGHSGHFFPKRLVKCPPSRGRPHVNCTCPGLQTGANALTEARLTHETSHQRQGSDHLRVSHAGSPQVPSSGGARSVRLQVSCRRALVASPGSVSTRSRAHPETEEIYYCARGRGKLLLDDEVYPLEEGTAAYVGPGVLHQVFNTGSEELLMIWFESPPSCEVGGYKPMKLGWQQTPSADLEPR